MPSSAHLMGSDIIAELGSFIDSRSSTFSCGGSVPIHTSGTPTNAETQAVVSPPVDLRWDSHSFTTGIAKATFPFKEGDDNSKAALVKLMQDCQPAGFGYKGEDVFDDSYRKAIKMDTSAFSVTFCPYETGIIDTIAQVLLPNSRSGLGTKGVRAELYKLNVYSAPSGVFKSHVDTPRADTQFGSLVVCLPCHHKGGQLIVRHAAQEVKFDWSTSPKDVSSIQWAAFYSDCEHEVLEVTDGHRVTLTYNLYCAPGLGDLAGNSPAMDVKSLPVYQKIDALLNNEGFMPDGGYLGMYCRHAYAHNTAEAKVALPWILKGADMAVYEVFRALGLKVEVRAVLDHLRDYEDYGEEYSTSDDGEPGGEINFLGNELGEIHITEVGGFEEAYLEIIEDYPSDRVQVRWLTEPRWPDIGMVHLTYGNQAGIDYKYTYAALIVTVPKVSERSQEGTWETGGQDVQV